MSATRCATIFYKRAPASHLPLMDFTTPKTPPRGGSHSKAHRAPPVFVLPTQTPKPAKCSQVQTPASHTCLATPNTSRSKGRAAQQRPSSVNLAPPHLPWSPEFTPHRSPRSRKKKLNVEDFFSSPDATALFLPNHSTVGSGRKSHSPMKALRAPISLDTAELSKLNENLAFEQDDLDLDSSCASPCQRAKRRKGALAAPATPGGQLITPQMVEQWHGKSFNIDFSDDSDDETVSTELVNPFIASSKPKSSVKNPFATRLSKPTVNYATHVEYINHRTGERKVEELLESEKKFKPKRIDFSGI